MRILLALTYYRPHISGLTIYGQRLAEALAADGVEVTVLTSRYDRRLPADERLRGVRVVRVPVLRRIGKGVVMPGFPRLADRLIRDHDAVSVHLPQFESALYGFALWLAGRPLPVSTEWWYWPATRAIPHPPSEAPPITEFPFFTFLFGDLHAHLLALPYALLVLVGAVHLAAAGQGLDQPRAGAPGSTLSDRWRRETALLGLLGLVTGALWATNAWDLPTSLVLVGLGLGLREIGRRGLGRTACLAAGWRLVAVAVLGQLLFHPFTAHFARAYGSLAPWTGSRTPLWAYLGIHGFFLFGLTTYLLLAERHRGPRSSAARWTLGAGLAVAVLLAVRGQGLPALLLALAALASFQAVGPERRPVERLIALLILLGVGLSGAVELVVVRGDVSRMNTVFKLYLQVWTLWGVAAVAGTAEAWRAGRPSRWRGLRPRSWATAWVLLLAGALLYPALATPARLRHRFDPAVGPSLDGEAYLSRAVLRDEGGEFALAEDAAAIHWLQENVAGSPVVLEGSIPPYRWGSRVSVYTGLPTVLGWVSHQQQQRAALKGDAVARRLQAVRTIYTAPDLESVLGLLRRYEVSYVYVGPLERLYYPGPGLDKFESARGHFERVFENPQVRIYRFLGGRSLGG